jgi:hypothetical protein
MAHSSLRFGIGRFTTEAEIDFVIEKIVAVVQRLRDMRFVGIFTSNEPKADQYVVPCGRWCRKASISPVLTGARLNIELTLSYAHDRICTRDFVRFINSRVL